MVKIYTRKIICLTLLWLVALQSTVIAAYQNPLELSTSIHCEEQSSSAHHDCCLDGMTNDHCNSCFQTTLALTATEDSPATNKVLHRVSTSIDLFHPEPLLELFKPPI